MSIKQTEQIDEFCLKLNALVTNIRTLGEPVEESYVVKKILRSVPSKFLLITSAIEQFGKIDEISIEDTVGSLKAHEERICGQNENTGGQLLLTEEEWSRKENGEGQLLFTREEWIKKSGKGGTENSQGQKNRGVVRGVHDRSKELDDTITGQVRFGDGSTVERGKGTLSESGNRVVIKDEYLWVYDEKERILMKVLGSVNRLYKAFINNSGVSCLLSKVEETSHLWHSRHGQVNYQAMALMSKHGMAYGLPEIVQPKEVLRTDRGVEFKSKNFEKCCDEVGIDRHYTAPYSPQQNGVVKRRNRTIVAMARSFLKEKQLPGELWGEAARHSVYVLNRLPTRALSGKTPYEVWSGSKPDIGHIRIFGCIAHMKQPGVHLRKLDDRSKATVYLGRERETKACGLYDPEAHKILVSRDVIFEENKSWDWIKYEGDRTVLVIMKTVLRLQGVILVFQPESEGEDSEPRKFRLLSDIYNETSEVELEEELLLAGVDETHCYKQAVTEPGWEMAMKGELEAIEKNNTWRLEELTAGHKAIDLKWVYKLKKNTEGKVIKYKARLVAKGYVQRHEIDFEEVFVPVTRLETALYGLRQAPRAWYAKLSKCLEDLGFTKCPHEHAVYTKREGYEVLIIGVYVDDLLITGTRVENIERFKRKMSKEFDMSDLGKLTYYLGLEVNLKQGCIEVKQAAYVRKLLEKSGLAKCNPVKYPMEPRQQIGRDERDKEVNSTQFKSLWVA
ncbi:hypothetical protein AgCh_029688 [Apium graveolens]